MRRLLLKNSFVEAIGPELNSILIATIRIYSVLSMKTVNVVESFERKISTPDFVNLYCDLFATFHEGSKKYFQKYIAEISGLKKKPLDIYENRMIEIYRKGNEDNNSTYKALYHIRNSFSFHFSPTGNPPGLAEYIGYVDESGKVTFVSSIPALFKCVETVLGKKMGQKEIQTFFRETLHEEVRPFIEYLQATIHQIVDPNSELEAE